MHLANEFKIKDLGQVSLFLGVHIKRDNHQFTLSQAKYVERVLHRFQMSDCFPTKIPMQANQSDVEKIPLDKSFPFREAVGCLNFIATISRPDIAFVVHLLSRNVNSPTQFHWSTLKQTLRYLKGTIENHLTIQKNETPVSISAYVDADYGGDITSRKSCSGYLMYFGNNLISWQSRLQPIVASSTMEAEYIALANAVHEVMWLKNLLSEIKFPSSAPATIYEDNQACIKFAEDPGRFHKRTKHIDIRYHLSRDAVKEGIIRICYCPTTEMLADLLTKALPSPRFNNLVASLSVHR